MLKNLCRVLLVDDDPVDISVARRLLGERFEVETAHSLDDAWTQLRASVPDAIVLDLRLGNQRGEDLLELVRVQYPHVARIVLSGSSPERLSELERTNIADTIVKKAAPEWTLAEAVLAACAARATR